MLHDPCWKERQPWKWIAGEQQDLKRTFTSNQTWQQTPLRKDNQMYTYSEGLAKLGADTIERKREKEKEMKRPEFIGVVQRDVWGST